MMQCEQCGATFAPPENPVEVVSSRILCATCTEERRLRRAQRSAGAVAVGQRAVRPASERAAATATQEHDELEVLPQARGRRAPQARRRESDVDEPREARGSRRPRDGMDRTLVSGWIAAGVLTVIGVIVLLLVKAKHDGEAVERAAHEAKVTGFRDEMAGYDLAKEEQAQKALRRAEEMRDLWQDEAIAGEIATLVSRANSQLATARQQRALRDGLADMDAALADAGKLSAEQWLDLRRKALELEPEAQAAGADLLSRLKDLRGRTDRELAAALHRAATAAAAGGDDRQALAAHRRAEDEITDLAQAAHQAKDTGAATYYAQHLVELQQAADALATKVLTPQWIAASPSIDLLAADRAKHWAQSTTPDLEHHLQGGRLEIVHGGGEGSRTGAVTFADREGWHDLVADLELKLDQGSCTVFVHIGNRADRKLVSSFTLGPGSEVPVPLGSTARLRIRAIGGHVSVEPDAGKVVEIDTRNKSRKGTIGFAIPGGTRLTVTKLQVKDLR